MLTLTLPCKRALHVFSNNKHRDLPWLTRRITLGWTEGKHAAAQASCDPAYHPYLATVSALDFVPCAFFSMSCSSVKRAW